jgi:hypothetical protein
MGKRLGGLAGGVGWGGAWGVQSDKLLLVSPVCLSGFGGLVHRGLVVSMLASGTQVRGFKSSACLPSEGK